MIPVPGSGSGRSKQRPTRSPGESLMMARHLFWIWRRSRPFWGGLLVMIGASEMLLSEQDLLSVVPHIGIQDLAGYLIPAHLLLMGVLLWLNPIDRIIYSLIAIFLALWSWTTSNLGGFFVGMLLGMVGGALAFAWTTDSKHGSPSRRVRGTQRILSSSVVGIVRVGVHRLQQLFHPSGLGGVVRNAVLGASHLLLVRYRRKQHARAVGLDQGADPRLARGDDPPQQRMQPPAEPLQHILRQVSGMVSNFAGVLCLGQHPRDSDREHEDKQEAGPPPLPRVREPGQYQSSAEPPRVP